jgi:hypothetical protein
MRRTYQLTGQTVLSTREERKRPSWSRRRSASDMVDWMASYVSEISVQVDGGKVMAIPEGAEE